MKIAGKVFLVTGAGSGMGREMTHQIIAKGGKVAALDIHLPQLLETQQICSGGAANFWLWKWILRTVLRCKHCLNR